MHSTPRVATAFTLQVVEPHLNGPGGDVPVIVHDMKRGKHRGDLRPGPVAPAGATIAHYRSEGLEMVPGTGLLAACVPGTFETWMLLLRDYGTCRLRDVLEPAIAYARDGYPLVERANRDHRHRRADVPRNTGPRRPRSICRTMKCRNRHAVHQQDAFGNLCRILKEAESAGADRVAQIEARARRGRTASSPRRSTISAAPRRSWTSAARRIAAC
jgi:gamma-glutamyltranspeptidase/glutathione hydrolase